jgi:hypothetical protein
VTAQTLERAAYEGETGASSASTIEGDGSGRNGS